MKDIFKWKPRAGWMKQSGMKCLHLLRSLLWNLWAFICAVVRLITSSQDRQVLSCICSSPMCAHNVCVHVLYDDIIGAFLLCALVWDFVDTELLPKQIKGILWYIQHTAPWTLENLFSHFMLFMLQCRGNILSWTVVLLVRRKLEKSDLGMSHIYKVKGGGRGRLRYIPEKTLEEGMYPVWTSFYQLQTFSASVSLTPPQDATGLTVGPAMVVMGYQTWLAWLTPSLATS